MEREEKGTIMAGKKGVRAKRKQEGRKDEGLERKTRARNDKVMNRETKGYKKR